MPGFRQLLDDVKNVVDGYNQTDFVFTDTNEVPHISPQHTFGNGEEKKGEHIKTCVLYVDIRDSVKMTKQHTIEKMGTVFSAFSESVQMAAIRHNGHTRNIIGDRVMVVFPTDNCFKNAVDCAISINHLMKYVLNKKINGIDFQCGIGIDYGDMYSIKVGLPKQGAEREDNRRLVWIGTPANFASRLTDNANKEYSEIIYKVKNYFRRFSFKQLPTNGGNPILQSRLQCREEIMTGNEAINSIIDGKSVHIEPVGQLKPYKYNPILISEEVFNGFQKECPNYNSVINKWWQKETQKIKDIPYDVYGADLIWKM